MNCFHVEDYCTNSMHDHSTMQAARVGASPVTQNPHSSSWGPPYKRRKIQKKNLAVRQVTLMLQVAIETKGRELYYSFGTWMNLGRLGVGFKLVSDSPINQKL